MKFGVHKIECNFWEGFYCCWSWRNGFLKKEKKITRNRKKKGGKTKREGQRKAKRQFQVGSQKYKRICFHILLIAKFG
jgi:hypothetical protein